VGKIIEFLSHENHAVYEIMWENIIEFLSPENHAVYEIIWEI